MGRWIDAAARAESKMGSFATLVGVDEQYLLKMRKGQKPVSVQHLVAMKFNPAAAIAFCGAMLTEVDLSQDPEQLLALVGPLLASIGCVARPARALTKKELALLVLAGMDDGSCVTRTMIENIAARAGHGAEQVALALHGDEGDDE